MGRYTPDSTVYHWLIYQQTDEHNQSLNLDTQMHAQNKDTLLAPSVQVT